MQSLGKSVDLTPIVDAFVRYESVLKQIKDSKEMIAGDDKEMAELAKEELVLLESELKDLERQSDLPAAQGYQR